MTELAKEALGKLQDAIALAQTYAAENEKLEKQVADALLLAQKLTTLLENERETTEQLNKLYVNIELAYMALKAILHRGLNSMN